MNWARRAGGNDLGTELKKMEIERIVQVRREEEEWVEWDIQEGYISSND
jgi:hypothetical protein